jgi:hypothetical protein
MEDRCWRGCLLLISMALSFWTALSSRQNKSPITVLDGVGCARRTWSVQMVRLFIVLLVLSFKLMVRMAIARPFAEVRNEVAALLEGRVLVGHALVNDLGVT